MSGFSVPPETLDILSENADRTDREAGFPVAGLQALRDCGLMGINVPPEYGGRGASLEEITKVARTLAPACLSTAMIWAMHVSQADALVRHASADLRSEVLPRIAAGKEYLASVTTEAGRGSDLFTAHTPLRVENGRAAFTGRRAPVVTGGMQADGFLVTLRAHQEAQPHEVSLLYARREQLTLVGSGDWDPMGMRGTESLGWEISGEVPAGNVVGEAGKFQEVARESMVPTAHIGWSACWLGAAEGAYRRLIRWLRAPRRQGGPQVRSELLRERLGRIRVDLDLVSAYLHRVCASVEAARAEGSGLSAPVTQLRLNSLKLAASELTFRAVDAMLQTAGMGPGYMRSAPLGLERAFRDLRSARLNHSNDRMWPATGALALLDTKVDLL
ncbi:acyl-CoA/acyl-ACP dehydrogenase [Streptomyces sp. ME02-8801-2C]|uniref:acyl-CoA dehydrogenase family protein n=1 Tax=Streptomyces sp. ME02-8801-2C TaxID=3028680 RepID=UPI0029B63593|nr:acyl-CoA dehydrogenase family protein [Streptomyces sp. ME02-8801-2C]MDX3458209.1 acyl-CoA/acyl-ACP dehydrogenase [Streptomyces sp. ME02-8801-2C]